jgi:hypothetical protein
MARCSNRSGAPRASFGRAVHRAQSSLVSGLTVGALESQALVLRLPDCVGHMSAARAKGLGPPDGRIPRGLVLHFGV